MSRLTLGLLLALLTYLPAHAAQNPTKPEHVLFAWAGDVAKTGNDFLAVIDADPESASYGHLVTTVVTDQKSMQVDHTEYTIPASGLLFANDHLAGRTFIFDLRDPLHPKVATSFNDMGGYSHPHSYLRLPNGHVLASFQHTYQVWRLSDLKLLKTEYLDTGGRRYGEVDPEEPRRGPDGSVFVQTLACGIERITDMATEHPQSRLIHASREASVAFPPLWVITWCKAFRQPMA